MEITEADNSNNSQFKNKLKHWVINFFAYLHRCYNVIFGSACLLASLGDKGLLRCTNIIIIL